MKRFVFTPAIVLISLMANSQNQAPHISNATVNVPWASHEATITFDLSDAENDDMEVKLLVSNNGGQTFLVNVGSTSGDVGFPITPGTGKQIVWDFDTISNIYAYSLRLVADDHNVPDIQSIVDQVDSVILRNDLQTIQGIRHYQANPTHLEETKDLLEDRFNQFGLSTYRQPFDRAGYVGHNIIGRKAGLGQEQNCFIIDAHFDTVDDAPGADDNGSGTVGVLEALRVLAPYNFDKSIRFIAFDFEESVGLGGTYGSWKYTQSEIPAWETLEGVLNFEMIGYYDNTPNSQSIPTGFELLYAEQVAELEADSFRGNFIVSAGDIESNMLVDNFDSLAFEYVPDLKVTSLVVPLNGTVAPDLRRSDHANFWDINVPALIITDGANLRNPHYHSPADTLGLLNFTFMSQVVKAAVATVASLAGIQNSDFVDIEIVPSGIGESTMECIPNLYPNPTDGNVRLNWGDCFNSKPTLTCFDIQGKTVLPTISQIGNQSLSVNLSGLPAGVYFLQISGEEGNAIRRVILNR